MKSVKLQPIERLEKNVIARHNSIEQLILVPGTKVMESYAVESCPNLKRVYLPNDCENAEGRPSTVARKTCKSRAVTSRASRVFAANPRHYNAATRLSPETPRLWLKTRPIITKSPHVSHEHGTFLWITVDFL